MKTYARILIGEAAHFVEKLGASYHVLREAPWKTVERTGEVVNAEGVKYLPVSAASKVVCVGQNYRKHAQEMGKPIPVEPLLFLKAPSALNGHQGVIELPRESEEVHHEAELGLVIGRKLKHASEQESLEGIFAATCFNDVTARDIQRREIQHTRAKSYDTFACCGPVMVAGVEIQNLRIQCRVNGVSKQDGNTSDMIFPSAKLVSFISSIMTLEPGDVIATGTPSGVGKISKGDVVEVEIENVGILRNQVQ